VTEEKTAPNNAIVIKKYANRRLYNTSTSTYVTLDDLAAMVKSGSDFVVYDAKTGEDITRSVLTQIIFEEESKGTNLLPINFLRQLIRYYGDSMQALVPGYLEFSLDNLVKDQEKLRKQMLDMMGGGMMAGVTPGLGGGLGTAGMGNDALKSMEDHAKRNMAMFNDAMRMFNPFAAMAGAGAAAPQAAPEQKSQPASKDDLQSLKDQLAAMQNKLNNL
jgi:polyhydroxyalkanoate synthesis repressor PhaR